MRALPSRRVMLHADQRYYGPLGLPLPSRRTSPSAYTTWSLPDAGQADGSLLFQPRLCARAALHTPEGPGRLTPEQGLPGMAFAVT